MKDSVRLAVDVGGTFTDVALEYEDRLITAKVLTTPVRPEEGVIAGIQKAVSECGLKVNEVGLIIHGTTLATNALIERKGAKVALITTEGLRDSLEMAQENRFEQYDINIDRPNPLVPRYLRWGVKERLNYRGEILIELDQHSITEILPLLEKHEVESVAIGLIHSYANPIHEQHIANEIRKYNPELSITLSSEVCPEIREYERQSTACANAYVQPMLSEYLTRLNRNLKSHGFNCPFLLMTSGGGLTDLNTAIRFPVRLIESGPAGGAILAAEIAKDCDVSNVVSFDMGGTTAKICLIDGHKPQMTRTFEVARVYRNLKGSGLPVRIPAIEMVEIGAGGGSIASVDDMNRISVGPESAGAVPGPACYDQGGDLPTVTDADLVLGKIEPSRFAGGTVTLAPKNAIASIIKRVGTRLELTDTMAAFGISEIVDENMANAARVHAIEWGKDITARAMIAFGGAAPIHAARLAEKLGIKKIIIPKGAGVGSAIGFLRAPISYEVVRSQYMMLEQFDPTMANSLLSEMSKEARGIVASGSGTNDIVETRFAYMRYHGQGHEIVVPVPNRLLQPEDSETLRKSFESEYQRLYTRSVPGQQPEILSWTLAAIGPKPQGAPSKMPGKEEKGDGVGRRKIFDSSLSRYIVADTYRRENITLGQQIAGPALIMEDQTTIIVSKGYVAETHEKGHMILTRGV